MYADEYTPRSVLVSPSLSWTSMESCLTFNFFMSGNATGTLNVYLSPIGLLSHRTLIWNKTGDVDPSWKLAKVDIDTSYSLQVSMITG